MDLYQALQTILKQIQDQAGDARYKGEEREMLRVVLDNQVRLGEALLMLGGLMRSILAEDAEVIVMPGKDDTQH